MSVIHRHITSAHQLLLHWLLLLFLVMFLRVKPNISRTLYNTLILLQQLCLCYQRARVLCLLPLEVTSSPVCWSDCSQDYAETTGWIEMRLGGGRMGSRPRKNPIKCGVDSRSYCCFHLVRLRTTKPLRSYL